MSLYTAQNLSSSLLAKDNYTQLGFYSNAIIYLGQGLGSVLAVVAIEKLGDRKTMAFGAMICVPFVISLLVPALHTKENENNWIFSQGFVYTLILFTSLLNGLGEGAA